MIMVSNMTRAFGIFSGGLDSVLATRILMDQGLNPTLITFVSPFFSPDKALAAANALKLEIKLVDIYDDLLPLIKKPLHGLGRNLNPCIDCHTLMFKKAGQMLDEGQEPGFIYSGEVLGQRPMSQNPRALKLVAQNSGFFEKIVRPLSAKLLPPTEAEKNGLVNREELLGLSGRGRTAQLNLANKFQLDFPTPAGGCLLTDPAFCRRLKWLLSQPEALSASWPPARAVELLKRGRLFSTKPGQWLIVGRNQADNQGLTELAVKDDIILHLEGRAGPTVLIPSLGFAPEPELLALSKNLAVAYGGCEEACLIKMETVGQPPEFFKTQGSRPENWAHFLISGNK